MPDDPADQKSVFGRGRRAFLSPWDRAVEPVPDWFRNEVMSPVLSDLQQPYAVALEFRFDPGSEASGLVWVRETGESGATGFGLPDRSVPRAELLVQFADWLQEQVFPETRGAWGQARPACPGHTHPAKPVELDREAWWICPADGRRIAIIGRVGC